MSVWAVISTIVGGFFGILALIHLVLQIIIGIRYWLAGKKLPEDKEDFNGARFW